MPEKLLTTINISTFFNTKVLNFMLVFFAFLVGLFFRIYNLNFGLPHSFYADEPELVEPAIKYTFELKDIVENNNYYKLVPVSFVYGTFPSYVLTIIIMGFSKISNFLGLSFDKETLYVISRFISALLSASIVPLTYLTYKKLFSDTKGAIISTFLIAFNWLYIVLGHYSNQDIFLAFLQSLVFLLLLNGFLSGYSSRGVVLLGVLYGLMLGTKITSVILLPIFMFFWFYKRDFRSFVAFLFVVLGGFVISNPFAVIFAQDYLLRLYEMFFKEAGVVLDSYNPNIYKYLSSAIHIVSLPIFIGSLFGLLHAVRKTKTIHLMYFASLLIYLMFFTLSSRRVDRWLAPVLPVLLIYFSYFWVTVVGKIKFQLFIAVLSGVLLLSYIYYPILLLTQYNRHTPKSSAYIWMKENSDPLSRKLVITEEGLDPMNKLPNRFVHTFNLYENEGAFLSFPPALEGYDYIILSSKPESSLNTSSTYFINKYSYYYQRWFNFYNTVRDSTQYELVYEESLPKPALSNLSDVWVYKSLKTKY